MTVNGQSREADVEPRLLLVHFLRENLGLTGTKIGCDTSQCGSCVVRMNGSTVKSCTALAVQADGADITTIEGLAADGELHAVQEAFWNKHGLQCGYCTAGMIMTAVELLERNPNPTSQEVRDGLEGQHLPLHGLPQHRPGSPSGCRGQRRLDDDNKDIRLRHPPPRGPAPNHRRLYLHRRRNAAGHGPRGHPAQSTRPRPHHRH